MGESDMEKTAEDLEKALEMKRDADYMLLTHACSIIECYEQYRVVSNESLDVYNELKETAKQRMQDFNIMSEQLKKNFNNQNDGKNI